MLTTLLSIGKTLRNQPGAAGIRHHRYIRPIPTPDQKKGMFLRRFEILVADDMSFDLDDRKEIQNEKTFDELFYLNYKTSNADTMKKYVFGDICRYQTKRPADLDFTEAEVNFVLGTAEARAGSAYLLNSFDRGQPDAQSLDCALITAFRRSLAGQMNVLLGLFEQESSVYLNFRFGSDRLHWYELEAALLALNAKMLDEFVAKSPEGYVLTKSLHKTLAADKGAMPRFQQENDYKTWAFPTLDEVSDLLYAVDFSQRAMIRKGDIKIVVLPRGDEGSHSRLDAQAILQFFDAKGIRQVAASEEALADTRPPEADELPEEELTDEELTRPHQRAENIESITQFDFIFSKASASPSAPDIDMIELAGVSKSRIGQLYQELKGIAAPLQSERDERFRRKGVPLKKQLPPLRILNSFNNVLGDLGRDKKKYGSHLLKVLPQIYCGGYIQDDLLMPAFLATCERSIRDGSPNYDFLRFDLLFLLQIQAVNRKDNEMLTKIQEQPSYKAGYLLGKMAQPLRSKINSFEKNYVGLLSRRVAQLQDVIVFQNFIDEKLILHDCAYRNLQIASCDLAALLREFSGTYNREECVFGFFEAYFSWARKEDISTDGNGEAGMENHEISTEG